MQINNNHLLHSNSKWSVNYLWRFPSLIEVTSIWLLGLLIASVLMAVPSLSGHSLSTLIALLLALGLFLLLSNNDLKDDRLTHRLLVLLFLVHLSISLAINLFWWWPQSYMFGEGDKWLYERLGWMIAQDGLNLRSLAILPLQDLGTTVYVGIIYILFGRNPAAIAIVNTLIVALTCLQIYRMAIRYGGIRAARRSAVLWILLPATLLHSSFPSKEILVSFLGVFIIGQVEYILDQPNNLNRWIFWRRLGLVVISLLAFLNIRAIMVIPLIAIVLAQYWIRQHSFRSAMKGILIAIVFGVIAISFFSWRSGTMERQTLITPLPITVAHSDRLGFTYGPISSSLTLRTYWNMDWRRSYWIPIRIPLTLYAPFPPTQFSNIYDASGSLNVIMLILITPGIIGALFSKPSRKRKQLSTLLPVWMPVLGVGTALSAGLPFMQWRYAIMAYPFMIILAAIGFENWKYTKRYYWFVGIATFMLLALYYCIKSII